MGPDRRNGLEAEGVKPVLRTRPARRRNTRALLGRNAGLPYQLLIMLTLMERDQSLDALLELDGQVLVIDPETNHWVRLIIHRVPESEAKLHGLDYSLTLHSPDGDRLVGFDNAHRVRGQSGPGGRPGGAQDHRHRLRTVRPYEYRDAAALLADFWNEVDAVLRERGVFT